MPKTDRLDARWLALLLAKEMLPASWIPPQDVQRLRDLTRLRQALRHDRTGRPLDGHRLIEIDGDRLRITARARFEDAERDPKACLRFTYRQPLTVFHERGP